LPVRRSWGIKQSLTAPHVSKNFRSCAVSTSKLRFPTKRRLPGAASRRRGGGGPRRGLGDRCRRLGGERERDRLCGLRERGRLCGLGERWRRCGGDRDRRCGLGERRRRERDRERLCGLCGLGERWRGGD